MAAITTTYQASAPGRRIFGYMTVAMIFTLIGAEARTLSSQHTGEKGSGNPLTDPPSIFLGTTAATALLVTIADTGSAGERLGVGLAGVALVVALFVNGGTVWRAISNITGAGPTGPIEPSGAQGLPPGSSTSSTSTSSGTGVVTL